MDERNLYRELAAWLRSNHPLVWADWESERKRLARKPDGEKRLLAGPRGGSTSELDELPADASISAITDALKRELELLGIGGGTPGVTPDGAPCIHLTKRAAYGSTYEESVTLARMRDPGYRRHLKRVFG
jgi:hypothetical protein